MYTMLQIDREDLNYDEKWGQKLFNQQAIHVRIYSAEAVHG